MADGVVHTCQQVPPVVIKHCAAALCPRFGDTSALQSAHCRLQWHHILYTIVTRQSPAGIAALCSQVPVWRSRVQVCLYVCSEQ